MGTPPILLFYSSLILKKNSIPFIRSQLILDIVVLRWNLTSCVHHLHTTNIFRWSFVGNHLLILNMKLDNIATTIIFIYKMMEIFLVSLICYKYKKRIECKNISRDLQYIRKIIYSPNGPPRQMSNNFIHLFK